MQVIQSQRNLVIVDGCRIAQLRNEEKRLTANACAESLRDCKDGISAADKLTPYAVIDCGGVGYMLEISEA